MRWLGASVEWAAVSHARSRSVGHVCFSGCRLGNSQSRRRGGGRVDDPPVCAQGLAVLWSGSRGALASALAGFAGGRHIPARSIKSACVNSSRMAAFACVLAGGIGLRGVATTLGVWGGWCWGVGTGARCSDAPGPCLLLPAVSSAFRVYVVPPYGSVAPLCEAGVHHQPILIFRGRRPGVGCSGLGDGLSNQSSVAGARGVGHVVGHRTVFQRGVSVGGAGDRRGFGRLLPGRVLPRACAGCPVGSENLCAGHRSAGPAV